MQTSFLRWALSNRLRVELPGLRGFSASNIKTMLIFYGAWKNECQIRQTASAESVSQDNRPTSLGESVIRQSSTDELATCKWLNVFHLPRPGHRRCPPRTRQRAQRTCQEERSFMKKIGNTQSGTLLVEMTDAAFNFKADITDAQAEQIYKGFLNKKLFKESEGRIEW